MNKNEQTESLLAEAIAEMEDYIKELSGKLTTLTETYQILGMDMRALREKQGTSSQSVVAWEDHQAVVETYKKKQENMANEITELRSMCKKLKGERRYWASNQWAKHLFRWLFIKRHLWIWVVYAMFVALISLGVYLNTEQKREIQKLHAVEMKYRFLHAVGVDPDVLMFLDDAFEEGDERKLQLIHTKVKDYERSVRQKSDSIVRAEMKRMKEWE